MSKYPMIWHEQVCPKCGRNDECDGSMVEMEGDQAWQIVTCSCGARYIEVYEYHHTEVWSDDWDEDCEEEA